MTWRGTRARISACRGLYGGSPGPAERGGGARPPRSRSGAQGHRGWPRPWSPGNAPSVPYLYGLAEAASSSCGDVAGRERSTSGPPDARSRSAGRSAVQYPEGDRPKWNQLSAVNHFNIANLHFNGRPSSLKRSIRWWRRAAVARTRLDLGDREVQEHASSWPRPSSTSAGLMATRSSSNLLHLRRASRRPIPATGRRESGPALRYGFDLNLANFRKSGCFAVPARRWDETVAKLPSALANDPQGDDTQAGSTGFEHGEIQTAAGRGGRRTSARPTTRTPPVVAKEHLRDLAAKTFEICDKLSLVQSPTPSIRIISARHFFETACYREEELGKPDLELLSRSERLWADILREAPLNREARVLLVIVRRALAREPDSRGEHARTTNWRRTIAFPPPGISDIFHEIATGIRQARRAHRPRVLLAVIPLALEAPPLGDTRTMPSRCCMRQSSKGSRRTAEGSPDDAALRFPVHPRHSRVSDDPVRPGVSRGIGRGERIPAGIYSPGFAAWNKSDALPQHTWLAGRRRWHRPRYVEAETVLFQ